MRKQAATIFHALDFITDFQFLNVEDFYSGITNSEAKVMDK